MTQGKEGAESVPDGELLRMTAQVVASYVSKNPVSADQLPDLINSVHSSWKNVETAAPAVHEERQNPAVPVRKSVHPDYIVCLEAGKKLKMPKRNLRPINNMPPGEYRTQWTLQIE